MENTKNHFIINGKTNVILSSPHNLIHYRDGVKKDNELYTKEIVEKVAMKTNSYAIYKTIVDDDDPNYSVNSSYRNSLIDLINKNGINYVLDIHGKKNNNIDIIIGINGGINVKNDICFIDLIKSFWNNSKFNVKFDYVFKASSDNNLSKNCALKTSAYAMQFEISKSVRENNLDLLVDILSEFVLKISKVLNNKKEVMKRITSGYSNKVVGILKNKSQSFENEEYVNPTNSNLFCFSSHKVLIDDFGKEDAIYLKKSGIDKNIKSFYEIPKIKSKQVFKQNYEEISHDVIGLDETTYNNLKQYGIDSVCVYNKTLGTTYISKIKKEDNKKYSTIWLSHKQRTILNCIPSDYYTYDEFKKILEVTEGNEIHEYFKANYIDTGIGYSLKINNEDFYVENSSEELDNFRREFIKLLDIYVMPSVELLVPKKSFFDILVGYSSTKVSIVRIRGIDEGTNNVRISRQMAKSLDVMENERLVLYSDKQKNKKNKISCRVFIDENIPDYCVAVPRNIANDINADYGLSIYIKRDNSFIFLTKAANMILTLLLTIISVAGSMMALNINNIAIAIIIIILITILTIITTFIDRRRNVKN